MQSCLFGSLISTSKWRKRDVAITKASVFIFQFTRRFGPCRPSSCDAMHTWAMYDYLHCSDSMDLVG
jgi:hypothetical protein